MKIWVRVVVVLAALAAYGVGLTGYYASFGGYSVGFTFNWITASAINFVSLLAILLVAIREGPSITYHYGPKDNFQDEGL